MDDRIPRDKHQDHTEAMAAQRREFASAHSGATFKHLAAYSFDPGVTAGNIENFMGVAQVPIGLAGPLLVHGEHAQGEFYVPMATSEGTLVASYNRGMRLLRKAGGVKVTVVDDAMQRAPVFVFEDARAAREFGKWLVANFEAVKTAAEGSTRVGRLRNIEQYQAARMLHCRFNFTTGDAAGQNMVGKATYVACEWIKQHYPGIQKYLLSGGMDTDKKHSQLNTLHSRGKRVIAEATIPRELMLEEMGLATETLMSMRLVGQQGVFMAGAVNNGLHSANGITAVFIATGQDVANVAESSSIISYAELDEQSNYYVGLTIPSLICASYGGGTALPSQRECLELLGCCGAGKALKLAELIAATVLCGEFSLAAAIVAGDWVSSHDQYGRNRK